MLMTVSYISKGSPLNDALTVRSWAIRELWEGDSLHAYVQMGIIESGNGHRV
jgi:hypothetical protein